MSVRRVVILFSLALVLYAFGAAVKNSIFANFLVDEFQMTAEQRGWLEVPRELPGLLVTFAIGLFFFISEMKLLGYACILGGLGMIGLSSGALSVPGMVWWLFLWSMGAHIQLVLIERVALDIGLAQGVGERLGRMNGWRSLGLILGALFVSFFTKPWDLGYDHLFRIAAFTTVISGIMYLYLVRNGGAREVKRSAFVFKKRYSRYFVLSALYGLRKQIFLTFAPWFLVQILSLAPEDIARVLMVSAALGIVVKPACGWMIDRWGERRILIIDGILSALFSLGYVVFPFFFSGASLVILCASCYIMDEMLMTLRTARTTWLIKIAESNGDVTGTMSMSVSIEHVVSMALSCVAGYSWVVLGYQSVFIFCAVVALLMSVVSMGIHLSKA